MRRMGRICVGGGIALGIFLGATLENFAVGQAQTQAAAPLVFDAATVKPNTSGLNNTSTNSTNGLLRITNQTLRSMIQYAYNIRDFQISGGPGWMATDRFDVLAKPETGAHDQQMKQMLQALLTERFQLQFHRETREGAVYGLLILKNGPKLQPTADPNNTGTSSGRNADTGRSTMTAKGARMQDLAASLAARLGRPVIDQTGLTGKFDFELSWIPDATMSGGASPDSPPPENSGPSIFTALQEQLGLRLVSQKGPIESMVIDRAEKPAEQ